jgi:hypothetical protein
MNPFGVELATFRLFKTVPRSGHGRDLRLSQRETEVSRSPGLEQGAGPQVGVTAGACLLRIFHPEDGYAETSLAVCQRAYVTSQKPTP